MIDFHQDFVFMTVLDKLDKVIKEPKMETKRCEPPLEDVEGEKERALSEKIAELADSKFRDYLKNADGQDLLDACEKANDYKFLDELVIFLILKQHTIAIKLLEEIFEAHLRSCARQAAERELS